jgi:UTP--glucose-1-phosphate uridylyltransferase
VLQIIADEAFGSGIEEICVVCAPGDAERYKSAFRALRDNLRKSFKDAEWARKEAAKLDQFLDRVQYVEQAEPLGYGHAVYCAKDFVGDEPFLLLLGDYLYVSNIREKRCAAQLIELATAEGCPVSAVNPTPEHLIGSYGTITGKHVPGRAGIYEVEKLIEKPSLSLAELELQTPGLRIGYYLCFFGMHVLTPAVFNLLEREINAGSKSVLLTPALQELAQQDRYLALEVRGSRYDLSRQHGLLRAQVALGLAGEAHDETLSTLVELLAEANSRK